MNSTRSYQVNQYEKLMQALPGKTSMMAVNYTSDNISVEQVNHIDAGFKYSDHNPVTLQFILND